jgi:hypothetical protein
VTWIQGKGFRHSLVDTGEALPTENRAPVLVPGGEFPARLVEEEFRRRSVHLSPPIRRLVLSKIFEFGSKPFLIRFFLLSIATVVGLFVSSQVIRIRSGSR